MTKKDSFRQSFTGDEFMRFQNQSEFQHFYEGKVDPFLLFSFWEALGNSYFKKYDESATSLHLELLTQLHHNPWPFEVSEHSDGIYLLTLVCPDKLGLFALLSGLLAGQGFSIQSGDLYTFELDPHDAALAGNDTLYRRSLALDILEFQSELEMNQIEELISSKLNELMPLFIKSGLNGIRGTLQYAIGQQLSNKPSQTEVQLIPLDIQFRNSSSKTELLVNGEDSDAFLFVLSTVLAMRGLNVRKVRIQTVGHRVEDKFFLVDREGKSIEQPSTQEAIRRDVLMVKQFIHFLNHASDYQLAFQNFFQLLQKSRDNLWEDEQIDIHDFFSKLAKILGTGSFLWEEFSRIQFKELRPLLNDDQALKKTYSYDELETIVEANVYSDPFLSTEERVKALNKFKNQELFRLDLKHLVFNDNTFEDFSRELVSLAEVSLKALYKIGFEHASKIYGTPYVGEKPVQGALLAFGKFGGYELGYASDLEVVFIYEGAGKTQNGKKQITNQEFFNKLVQWLNKNWIAKSDGIFELDWRLRPYGEKGSWSASFDFWKNYYEDETKAHFIEIQAMTKMRGVLGSAEFLAKCLAVKNSVVYEPSRFQKTAFMEMRDVQLKSHLNSKKLNAKYSPGGLVDIEYTIQLMQMERGLEFPELNQTNVLFVLRALLSNKIIQPSLFEKLNNAYAFQRRLINALRMVRGNAKDLEIPEDDSSEWEFLERRMGYFGSSNNPYGSSLRDDINFHFNQVALFYDEYFNGAYHEVLHKGGLPELLEGLLAPNEAEKVLAHYGVRDFEKSQNLLQRIYDFSNDQASLMSILVVTARNIRHSANPEGVLLNLERFMSQGEENEDFFRRLLEYPEVLRQMILVFSTSSFLSNVIEQDPEALFDLNETEALWKKKSRSGFRFQMTESLPFVEDMKVWMDEVRKIRNKEYLRIFLRDMDQKIPMHELTEEISDLSMILAEVVFERVFADAKQENLLEKIEIIALGKLGARELNYSSDIDLVYFWNDDEFKSDDKYQCEKLLRKAMRYMTSSSQYGQLFRVDTALRPHGQQGGLIASRKHYLNYYANEAQGWELQAWLKSCPFWNRTSANLVIHPIHKMVKDPGRSDQLFSSMKKMRDLVIDRNEKHKVGDKEIKNGIGGLRTLEFYLQSLSIEWARRPDFKLSGNSLRILYHGWKLELITEENYEIWQSDYIFLRQVEHLLQIDQMQQKHTLPDSPKDLEILAMRMGFRGRLDKTASDLFMSQLAEVQQRNIKLHHKLYSQSS